MSGTSTVVATGHGPGAPAKGAGDSAGDDHGRVSLPLAATVG